MKNYTVKKYFLIVLYITCTAVLTSCATVPIATQKSHPVDSDIAKKNAIYAMIAHNVYEEEPLFPLEIIGWKEIKHPDNWFMSLFSFGLHYQIFEHEHSNVVVIAFRDTKSLWDWGANLSIASLQFEYAHYRIKDYLTKIGSFCDEGDEYRKKKIILTGHSLGGGLAIGMSLRCGLDAVAFNSSPRFFDGFGLSLWSYDRSAHRVLIFQKGEALEIFRKLSFYDNNKSEKIVLDENTFTADFSYECIDINDFFCSHAMEPLALGLLRLGKCHDDNLDLICEEMVDCNPMKIW